MDMKQQQVFESLIGKQQQILLATQVVKMILKCAPIPRCSFPSRRRWSLESKLIATCGEFDGRLRRQTLDSNLVSTGFKLVDAWGKFVVTSGRLNIRDCFSSLLDSIRTSVPVAGLTMCSTRLAAGCNNALLRVPSVPPAAG